MEKIVEIFIMMLLILIAIPVNGQVLDQSQTTIDDKDWLLGGEWQEFIPQGHTHYYIEVHIGRYYSDSHPITLSVEKPLGTVIASDTLPASSVPINTEGWVRFYLNATFPKNELYYLVLDFDQPDSEYSWSYGLGNPYPPGESSYGPNVDYCFRTFVDRSKSNYSTYFLFKQFINKFLEEYPLIFSLFH